MKVILTDNINNFGSKGDIKDVSDGYASNFLLPSGKAILASAENIIQYKASKSKSEAKVNEQNTYYQKIAKTLNKQSVNFSGKTSDKETLFQGVSSRDIIAEVKSKFNLDISENWFVKASLLKKVGRHTVFLRLPDNKLISFFINIKAL